MYVKYYRVVIPLCKIHVCETSQILPGYTDVTFSNPENYQVLQMCFILSQILPGYPEVYVPQPKSYQDMTRCLSSSPKLLGYTSLV